ncbi:EAL domain-containing response regulator [Vibrio sp. TRT 1302]|uniref:EAL domain-containing response regulator n=1 Tax=Vibrio sp. TRT 1302 TaxID=3418504 RepID=UPI003CED0841
MYKNVLLIDDSNIDREVTNVYLKDLGVDEVQHAENGEIASRILATERFELIICDIDMPICDGLDFVRILATIDKSIPILMISSVAQSYSQSLVLMAEQLGLKHVSFLQKPLCIDTIEETLRCLLFSQSMNVVKSYDHFKLRDLLSALYGNQIVNYYQKKVAIGSMEVVGYEVLSRFEHPTQGTIPPSRFLTDDLPTSFYTQLFLLSLEKAICYWKQASIDVSFSINAPPDIFSNSGLVKSIIELVNSYNFNFDKIIIEVTEGKEYFLNCDFLYAFNKLSLVGVKFSIDDFGDDYATYKKLASLAFHELKISRQLILAGSEDEKTYALIKNIVLVCRDLNIQTVAEGIENQDLFRLAKDLRFDICQGFLLGKPSPQI